MILESAAERRLALEKLKDQVILGRRITAEDTVTLDAMLFIGNLDTSIDDAELRALCTPFGQIIRAFLLRDSRRAYSKGYGIVEFATHAQANSAKGQLSAKMVAGRSIRADWLCFEKTPVGLLSLYSLTYLIFSL